MDQKIDIISLHKLGKSPRQIARELKISRNTVKKYLKLHAANGDAAITIHKLDKISACANYREQILEWLAKEQDLSFLRIWEKLKQEHSYEHGYDSVRRFVRSLRSKVKLVGHFEEKDPAEEAQVDFGYVGKLFCPNTKRFRKAYVFCMRLIYSRYDYYEVVFDQSVKTFLECHINAFFWFGGAPKTVKVDNLKAAVLEASFYTPTYQKEYLEFAKYYGFNPIACRVYKPRDKAFVENGIKYVKGNFFAGRSFKDIEECNTELKKWIQEKAKRTHGTTRRVPERVFLDEEKKQLNLLPDLVYEIPDWSTHKLHPDCFLRIDKCFYSAPHEHIGKTFIVKKLKRSIEVYDTNYSLICVHLKATKLGQKVKNPAHFPDYIEFLSKGTYQYVLKRAEKYGEEINSFCIEVLERHGASGYTMVQGILSLATKYPRDKVLAAIKRSSHYNSYSYISIKNILTKNLLTKDQMTDFENNQVTGAVNNPEYIDLLKEYDDLVMH